MLSLWVWLQNAMHDERGQTPSGTVWLVVAIAIIIACIVFVWVNVDINEN